MNELVKKELEKNKNWLDDILNDATPDSQKTDQENSSAGDEPLVFERIAVFEELDDDE